MKRVSSKLLLGAVFALLALCVSIAQSNVSIIGINAYRAGNAAEIELITTGPAAFTLEPLTGGEGLFAWADNFSLDEAFGEIPLDLGQFGLAEIIDRASMVNAAGRSGVRLYLGPKADVGKAFVVNDGSRITITIPQTGELAAPAAEAAEELLFTDTTILDRQTDTDTEPLEFLHRPAPETVFAAAGSQTTIQRADDFTSLPPYVLDNPGEVWPPVTDDKPVSEPELPSGPEPIEFDSFTLNDNKQVDPVTPGFRETIEPLDAGTQIAMAGDLDKVDPKVNFQRLYADPPPPGNKKKDDPNDAEDTIREDIGEKVADEAAPAAPAPAGISTDASTYSADAFAPAYDEVAVASFGNKDDLSKIEIELFEILDTPLDDALTLLISPTRFNIIVDSSVGDNTISLSFKDKHTNLKSALDLITKVYGLKYVVEAGTVVVASAEKMEESLIAQTPRMFVLSWAHPLSIKNILVNTGLVAETHVEVYTGEENYPDVADQTELSTESSSESTEIKEIKTSLASSPRNVIVVRAAPDDMMVIAQIIDDLDRKPKLIELDVRVCEAGENALRDLGVDLNNNSSTATPTAIIWSEQVQNIPGDIVDGIGIEDFTSGSFQRNPLNFLATLNTQIQDGTVELLAQPTLTTLEGKQAIYFAGERVPYISKVSQTQSGQQIEVDFLNIGITLNFKPRIDAEGLITIDVNPIVSSLLEFRIIGGLVEAPRTSSRQMATTVRVQNREPFVLAGLITETERTTITKVPLLGDLPLVGKLFRNKNHKGERTEIIVVVTPIINE